MPMTHDAWPRSGKWLLLEKPSGPRNAPQRPMEFETFYDLLEYCRQYSISASIPN